MPKKAPANPPLRFINEIDAKLETENAQRRTVDALPTTAATNNVAEMRNAKRSKKRGGKRRKWMSWKTNPQFCSTKLLQYRFIMNKKNKNKQ